MTCCAKLQAFGLVIQVRQNPGKTFGILPYSPLKEDMSFLNILFKIGHRLNVGQIDTPEDGFYPSRPLGAINDPLLRNS